MKNISREDYLRTIYSIYEKQGIKKIGVRSIDIANSLGVSKPSVSIMIKKLAKKGFLKVEPYSNIFLTKRGLKEAKKLVHKYKVIELFLREILRYDNKNLFNRFIDSSEKACSNLWASIWIVLLSSVSISLKTSSLTLYS
jgi:Mn-dependent DtxR family transcriptional regulator